MGFPRPFFRAAVAVASTAALGASVLGISTTATADPVNPIPVSGTALPTAQVNGVVWAQTVSSNIDFVGGSFSQSQPAGAAAGVGVVSRANLFAFDVTTGAAVPGFSATTNAQVRGIAASADGSRIYIVGDFTVVDGQPRNHIAAIDRNGALLSDFAPSVNGSVLSVVARGDSVYFGGTFTAVNGVARSKAAAVTTTGAVLPYAPAVQDGTVRAIAMSPDGGTVLLGGSFATVNGGSYRGLASTDSASGASKSWATNSVIWNHGSGSAIYSLSTRGSVVYATGYVYSSNPDDGNLEGAVAMNWADGSVKWIEDCHGDTYSSYPFNDALYTAGHAHDCSTVIDGWTSPDAAPSEWRRAQAFSQSPAGWLATNPRPGYANFGGTPSPRLLDWFPTLNTGTYTGLNQGAWSVAAGGSYVVYGGEFTTVNGAAQTGLTRFQGQPEPADGGLASPPTTTPTTPPAVPPVDTATVPNTVSKPSVAVLGPTKVGVRWSAPKNGAADKVTGYVISAYKGAKVVASTTAGSTKRLATLSGLKKATSYRVAVTAKNAVGAGKRSSAVLIKTKAKGKNVSATKKPSKVKKPTTTISKARVRVKWSAASVSGALGVSKYQVRVVLHGKTVKTYSVAPSARSKVVTGLKRRTGYTVSVRAENWAGWGSWSSARSSRTR